ncbi:MAG: hypothetical protein IKD20_05560 [Clostridia bacterium]|nr:hypothetical protein [Clostridia bacterium]
MSSFRDLANSAKKRLKSGYWQDMYDKRDEAINRAIEEGESPTMLCINLRKELKNNFSSDRLRYENEDNYRKIIENILDEESATDTNSGIVSDAIGRLIDVKRYEQMPLQERERYVLFLSKMYLDLKGKIIGERKLK